MQIELSCIDKSINEEDFRDFIFTSSSPIVDLVSLPSSLLSRAVELGATKLSCLVDFPNGMAHNTIRQHEILYASRFPVKSVDIVLNTYSCLNLDIASIISDISSCMSVCESKKLKPRVTIEHRFLSQSIIIDICQTLSELGIYEVCLSSGAFSDYPTDNIILSKALPSRTHISIVGAGPVWNLNQFNLYRAIGVKSVKFTSVQVVKTILGPFV